MRVQDKFIVRSTAAFIGAGALLTLSACGPKEKPATETPEPAVAATPAAEEPKAEEAPAEEPKAEEAPAEEPAAEPAAPAAKVPEGSFAVGTFNLEWAFDAIEDKRPKKAQPNVPKTDEEWEWKRDRIVEVLVAERLDVVVLTELGGERELSDIVTEITVKDGYDYSYAWVESSDKFTGQDVGIISRYPIENERRYEDTSVTKHVAADIELPGEQWVTVIAVQFKEGKFKGSVDRRRSEAKSIKRFVKKEQRKNPVIIAGTLGSPITPDADDYKDSAPGILTSKGCTDSASESSARGVTVSGGEALDRVIVCGLKLESAEVAGQGQIKRGDTDPDSTPWVEIPVDDGAKRDVSDHYLLWSQVEIPKKAAG
ncbi:MAG: hypothetical protein AAF799_09685 [Myxococcota bacterium]